MDDSPNPVAFHVRFPDEDVDRMWTLIKNSRLPKAPFVPDAGWDYGVSLEWLKEMKEKWLNEFSWHEAEAKINSFHHFKVQIEGIDLHFIHHKSKREDAIPILLTHGWPGSFWEFHRMIEPLTNPPPNVPAFHVVIPSLPGFTFSSAPPIRGWTMQDNARIFDHLMTNILGYQSYMAQGGDWGGFVTSTLGTPSFPACKLINLNMCVAKPTFSAFLALPLLLLPLTWRNWLLRKIYPEDELTDLTRSITFLKYGMGYFVQQATRPFSLGYALYDSPMAIMAWVGEKYIGGHNYYESRDQDVLTTVSLYCLTQCIHTTTLPYSESWKSFFSGGVITKPYGLSRFPYDIFVMPLSWIRARHPNLVFARRHPNGGHFPALEVPELLVGDLREMASQNCSLFQH
ncbi:peptidase S33 family protein [Abortiporus biennis]